MGLLYSFLKTHWVPPKFGFYNKNPTFNKSIEIRIIEKEKKPAS